MFRALLIFVFAAPLSVFAANYTVPLGQSIAIQNGDTALVQYGSALTAVSCGGGAAQPARQQFEAMRWARFSDLFQNGPDISRTIECGKTTGEQAVTQATSDAENAAREACFSAGYQRCAPPAATDEQYSYYVRGSRAGDYVCQVVARIVGTNP